ncbi:MAG: DUF4469 domain-containing protein [Treponema sp.]|jgi:hypothetical protein|nr:DUF4469 domain-containing protein [Treponema sp.]
MEELSDVNILRASAYESKLATVPAGHLTLSLESVGYINRNTLARFLREDGLPAKEVEAGLEFFDRLMRKITNAVTAGYSVDTDWFRAAVSLSGTVPVERLGHHALPGEVEVHLNLLPDKRLRDEIVSTPVLIRKIIASNAPVIQVIMDAVSETPDVVFIGEMAEIRGLNIAVQGNKVDEIGVFFTSADGSKTIHVPAGRCKPNTAGLVQFVAPPTLSAGQWTVRLATQTTGRKGVYTQDVREDVYAKQITVEAFTP